MRCAVAKIFPLTCLIVLLLPTLGLADLEVAYGIVQDVDKESGRITIMMPEGETVVWAAASTLLSKVESGDRVRIELRGGKITGVEKAARL